MRTPEERAIQKLLDAHKDYLWAEWTLNTRSSSAAYKRTGELWQEMQEARQELEMLRSPLPAASEDLPF